MPLQATSGAASYDAFGGGVPVVTNYIEDVFSTWLYSGTGAAQTITNGIDLSGKGGLTWIKIRDAADSHILTDTVRGVNSQLKTNTTGAAQSEANRVTSFTSSGFVLGVNTDVNQGGAAPVRTYASWTFREQPKFFDVVTYTGNGTNGRTVAHSLGSVPGCMIVKRTDASNGWAVYHRSMNASPQDYMMRLNATDAAFTTSPSRWNNTLPTATEFTLSGNDEVNGSGATYVAYLFAHNAGGFGLTGTDNVISCGSFVYTSPGPTTVTLGYEPQYILYKDASNVDDWYCFDTMRGFTVTDDAALFPNLSAAENTFSGYDIIDPTSTGFKFKNGTFGATYIYIAIRRGPMKVPTSGTSVFDISTVSTSSGPVPGPTPTDMTLNKPSYNVSANDWRAVDRLRGGGLSLFPNTTGAESAENYVYFDYQSGLRLNSWPVATTIWYNFKRAPSFFDEVCYTGNATARTLNHNLTVAPEMLIVKSRSDASDWFVWATGFTISSSSNQYVTLDTTDPKDDKGSSEFWNSSYPTSSVFGIGNSALVNNSGSTYVAYLFATAAGVSKVGSYTGNGTTQTINCGFTSGARFVLIKRTDSAGNWYVYDTTRGMTTVTDPYLLVNSSAAQVATLGSVTTVSTGFALDATILAAINTNAASYIFLAIA